MGGDLIVDNALIVDGTGNPPFRGSLHIGSGRILEVIGGTADPVWTGERLDAEGLAVAPGFIDSHVHTDLDLLARPAHSDSLAQGVTTHIIGQDGVSYAPMTGDEIENYGWYFGAVNGQPDTQSTWPSVGAYRRSLHLKTAVNTAYLAPHGTIRYSTMGMTDQRPQTEELRHMQAVLAEAFEDGAVGFSTGLSYFPGSFSRSDELVELCRIAARYARPYVTHLRTVYRDGVTDGLDEAIGIAERSGVSLHISHFRTKVGTAGKAEQIMARIDQAYERGLDITFDTYPYVYGSGPLSILLPPWAMEGGKDETLDRLRDPRLRERFLTDYESNISNKIGRLTYVPCQPYYEGRDLDELATELDKSTPELIFDLLRDNGLNVGYHGGADALIDDENLTSTFDSDCLELLDRPYSMVGSDGIYVGSKPHERGFGTFPKLIRLSRERGFPLTKMINRLSKNAADRFGLSKRGEIVAGFAADCVLFDPESMREMNSPRNPRRTPEGVRAVITNGELTYVHPSGAKDVLAGHALSPGYGQTSCLRSVR